MLCRFLLLMAAALPFAAGAELRVVEEIAAKVNGDIITRGELEGMRQEAENELRSRGLSGSQLDAEVKRVTENALRDKIDELLLVQRAKDLNLNVDTDISRWIASLQVRSKISDPDKFAAYVLEQSGVTLEEFKLRQKNQLLAQRVISGEVGARIAIPEAELRKYYDEHKADFVREEQVFLSQILISTEGKDPDQLAAAEKKAKELVARARQGEKFSELATTSSDDAESARNGGYIGTFKRADLRPEIADRVFTQKKGYITDVIPIDSPKGLLILKVEDRYEAGQAPYEMVRDEIQSLVAEPRMTPRLREFLTKLRQDAFLEIREGYVDTAAAPGKDTAWTDVAKIKPETTTKEEVAAAHRRKILWLVPYGKPMEIEPEEPAQSAPDSPSQPAPSAPAAPASGAPVTK